jgi:hypothetical protein
MTETTRRPSRWARLSEKWPEILIEAASIVVALLLAFAVNDWHERNETRERAAAARAGILAELGENRDEIRKAQPTLQAIVDRLNAAIADDAPPSHELSINLGISLLSGAAWHAALATRASQSIDYAWMLRVAQVYELQDNYVRVQNAALDALAAIPADKSISGKQVAASLVSRISTLRQLADGLSRAYDDVLGEHERVSR